jgi:hypothetical protein
VKQIALVGQFALPHGPSAATDRRPPVFRGGLTGRQARHLLALSGRRRDNPVPRRIAAPPGRRRGEQNVLEILRSGIDSALLGLDRASVHDLVPEDVLVPSGFTV